MMVPTETRNRQRQAGEITAAWGVYLLSIAGLMVYSLLSVLIA
jgi:hypothetical protein